MNCRSCQAQLAAGSTHCWFCGAAQPQAQRPTPRYLPGTAFRGATGAATPVDDESWRIGVSWLLFGLYAPIAGLFLLQREEWSAGLRTEPAPPTAPSQRGLFVLGVLVAWPYMVFSSLALSLAGLSFRGSASAELVVLVNVNLPVVGAMTMLWLSTRFLEQRFEALLVEASGSDPLALLRFRSLRTLRRIATVVTLLPLFVLLAIIIEAVALNSHDQSLLSALYILSLVLAPLAGSWLCIDPVRRYREALRPTP